MRLWLLALLLVGCTNAPSPQPAPAPALPELGLATFTNLPAAARTTLSDCTVPQAFDTPQPHNVLKGEFAQAGQRDWAIICSQGGRSAIRVAWGGPRRCPSELELTSNENLVKSLPDNKFGYTQRLELVEPAAVDRLNRRYGNLIPSPIAYQGLRQVLIGQTTQVQYCHEGKWYRLQEPSASAQSLQQVVP
ncbi:hypothetical protein [Candidatus Cyanaurora vandensis]|uniref:hypothetical protein n=1 Tax=Candidatus Cyanaurora vandensis TaxID=2714958 RepID=UPI002580DA2E|nr:hypothetical protein [Candidatus Cyanaurora vandensis]